MRTRVPWCSRPYSSLVGPNMQTITSAMSECPAVKAACIRLSAASEEGRSLERCEPTITTGMGRFCSM